MEDDFANLSRYGLGRSAIAHDGGNCFCTAHPILVLRVAKEDGVGMDARGDKHSSRYFEKRLPLGCNKNKASFTEGQIPH